MDPLQTAKAMGLELPSLAYILGSLFFGLVGWAAWRYGKKQEKPTTKWIGLALMVYPYFFSQTWLMMTVGVALCAGIFFDRG